MWAASARNVNVSTIFVINQAWVKVISKQCPKAVAVIEDAAIPWFQTDYCFSYIDLSLITLKQVWSCTAHVIITSRPTCKKQPPEWSWLNIKCAHTRCGGVTKGEWILILYSRASTTSVQLPTSAPRDLFSVLDPMVPYGVPCLEPKSLHLAAPSVLEF